MLTDRSDLKELRCAMPGENTPVCSEHSPAPSCSSFGEQMRKRKSPPSPPPPTMSKQRGVESAASSAFPPPTDLEKKVKRLELELMEKREDRARLEPDLELGPVLEKANSHEISQNFREMELLRLYGESPLADALLQHALDRGRNLIQFQSEIQAARKETARLRRKLADEIAIISDKLDAAREELRLAADERLAEVARRHSEELEAARDANSRPSEELRLAKEAHAKELEAARDANSRLSDELRLAKEAHAKELEAARDSYSRLSDELRQAKEAHAKELEAANPAAARRHAEELQRVAAEHKDKLNALKVQYQERYVKGLKNMKQQIISLLPPEEVEAED